MDINELRCRRCGAAIEARDVLEELAIAKCRFCSTVMDLSARDGRVELPQQAPPPARRPAVPVPERFKVEQQGSTLSIEWSWFTFATVFLLVFCFFWDGFLAFWYLGAASADEAPVFVYLFPLIHVAVGVGLTWTALAGLLNHTRLEVERGVMRVHHGPLPWPGNRELQVGEIDQFFCDESVHRGKNSTTYTYNLHVILKSGGQRLKLIGRLEKPEQALFLEHRLETFLGIVDVPISGELPKEGPPSQFRR